MIPCYLITLREDKWKTEYALEHFKTFGIVPNVIYGISGFKAALVPANPFELRPDGTRCYMHPAQVATCLSHIMALTVALSHGHDEFVIFEDDAELQPGFPGKLAEISRLMAKHRLDVVQLEHLHSEGKPSTRIEGLLHTCNYPFGAAAIMWTMRGAAKALEMCFPVDSPWDITLYKRVYPMLRHAIAYPEIVVQKTASDRWPSSIGGSMRLDVPPTA